MAEIRWNLVNHLREQIARGTYDNEKKLKIAVDRMLGREAPRAQDHRDVRVRGGRQGA